VSWSVGFAPLLPWPLVAALAALGAVVAAIGLGRRVRGAWLRALAVAALAVALCGPVILRENREALPTVVALVVDQSASQGLDDRTAATQAAEAELKRRFADLAGVELRTIDAAGPGEGAPSDGTELFGALGASLGDVPPDRLGAVIMLTDGEVHDVPASGADPALGGAPLHALISGHPGERDRRVVIDSAPRFGIVGERQDIVYRVLDEGAPGDVPVRVSISRDGEPVSVETVRPGERTTFSIEVPHGGQNILEFAAEPLDGELTELNNRAAVEITGIRENLRVLLVSGEPHAGERTWRNLLKSDASVDLVHFTILRPPEKQDGTPINELSLIAFPTRELFAEKIDQFDLIIFDRYQRRGVLPIIYFDNIARYVRDGGALLIASGPDYADDASLFNTPLSPVLPAAPTGQVMEEPFYATVTDRGRRHPVTRDLPGADSSPPHWSRWFRQVSVDQTRGDVILDGAEDKPLLILNREGEGRVALLLSDQAWLWARGYEGGGPHVDLLRRLAHWLMKEPDLEEEALRASARGGRLTVERQTMGDGVAPVTVRSPSGRTTSLDLAEAEPGLWRAAMDADEIGLWRIDEGDRHAFAEVGPPNPREFLDVRSTPDLLKPVADRSGGLVGRLDDGSGGIDVPRIVPIRSGSTFSGPDWLGIRMTEASLLKGIDRVPVFAGFLGLALLLGAVAAMWYREGR
jgi:hypothetical protein